MSRTKGAILTEKHKKNISLSCIGKAGWKKGQQLSLEHRKNISKGLKGKSKSPEHAIKCKENRLKGLLKQQHSKEPTSIEKTLYNYLLLKGILFERQYLVNGRFLVDAYIPSLNLIIEADGKYWHDIDRVVKKDKAENAYLTKCGFKLIRLTENEIQLGNFKERLVF
jgi:very-short-patch-repair endonuclease